MSGSVKSDDSKSSPPIDAGAVRVQLDRILSSHIFGVSPRLQEFLRYVVEETLEGRAARIKALTVAQDVFQRDNLEDPQESTIVRVEAGRLRRHLNDYYRNEGGQDPIRIRIAKGGYVPCFEPLSAENEETEPASPGELPRSRRLRFKPIGLLTTAVLASLITVVTLLWVLLSREEPTDRLQLLAGTSVVGEFSIPAIVIMPFDISGSEPEVASLAKGLTEDIVTDLSKLPGIDVIAMTSVQTYQDKDVSLRQIGKELRVSHVLRGSIRGTQQKLRVTAQLFETRTGKQVWAQRFDRQLKDPLALESELARNVAESIMVKLGREEREALGRSQPENVEARALYKEAMALRSPSSDPGRSQLALQAFKRVIEIDPTFAGGYAGVAFTHAMDAWWGHSQSPEDDIRKAIEIAEKAIEIDPSFGLSFSALAFAHMAHRDFDQALAASSKAVSLQPSDPSGNARFGFLLCTTGQAERGIQYAKRALRLDPFFPRTPYLNILGVCHFHAGQHQDALNAFLQNVERGGPYNPGIRAYMVATYASLGRYDEARMDLEILNMNDGGFAWRDWVRRSLKHERDADLVLRPIRELGSEERLPALTGSAN